MCKFLVPFSLLVGLGESIRWRPVPGTAASGLDSVVSSVGLPFTASPISPPVLATPAASEFPVILVCVWVCGFLGIACSWWIRWRRIRSAVAAGTPVYPELPLRTVSSPSLPEPAVFGVFRPVLLLPEGISDRLKPAQMQAVVAHELCHVRHRDNLIATIQMFVETTFWFHPLVWWIGKRMGEERELACDEEVLQVFTEPRIYADAILTVCKLYVESRLVCVSGVSGSNLTKRIEAIMSHRATVSMTSWKKTVFAAIAAAALATPIAIGIANAPALKAQVRPAGQSGVGTRRKFEVASVKPSKDCSDAIGIPQPPRSGLRSGNGPAAMAKGGVPAAASQARLDTCANLIQLIRTAYVTFAGGRQPTGNTYGGAVPIEGGRAWIRSESDLYQISAKADGPASQPVMNGPMMQALLEDRYELKNRSETREGAVYTLVLAQGGPKIQRTPEGSCTPRAFPMPTLAPGQEFCSERFGRNGPNATIDRQAMTLDDLSTFLFIVTDRPVVNRTGLAGRFHIHLEYTPDETTPGGAQMLANASRGDPPGSPTAAADPTGALSISTAVQQQLGLKLDAARGPRDYLVIDHIERPSAN